MKLNEKWYEAINVRTSRRSYSNEVLNSSDCNKIETLISEINNESKLNIKLIKNGGKFLNGFKASYGMISGANSFIALIGDRSIENLKTEIGYYGELIVLEATRLNLGTCWIGGTYKKEACESELGLKNNEELICVISIGYVKESKSLKEKLITRLAKNNKSIDDILLEKDANIESWIEDGINAVIKAPSAINKKPVGYTFNKGEIKTFITKENDGYEEIDLGISMAHFEIAAHSNSKIGKWSKVNGEFIFML